MFDHYRILSNINGKLVGVLPFISLYLVFYPLNGTPANVITIKALGPIN